MKRYVFISMVVLALVSAACKREQRAFQTQHPVVRTVTPETVTHLAPGASLSVHDVKNDYEDNAYAVSEGKRLFAAYNCNGCHSMGGGGMGPPLMDKNWLYGGKPEEVFSTIVAGRPNGMPSFGGRIPDFQIWQLAAYVRSMSGQLSKSTAPSRDDHLQGKPPESTTEKEPIKITPP